MNYVITPGQSLIVNTPSGRLKFAPGQESQLGDAWQSLASKARKAAKYSAAKNRCVIFKDPPPNPETGEIDYQPIPWDSVKVVAQVEVDEVTMAEGMTQVAQALIDQAPVTDEKPDQEAQADSEEVTSEVV